MLAITCALIVLLLGGAQTQQQVKVYTNIYEIKFNEYKP